MAHKTHHSEYIRSGVCMCRAVIFPPISADPPGQSSKPVVFEISNLSLLSVQSEGVGGRPTRAGKVGRSPCYHFKIFRKISLPFYKLFYFTASTTHSPVFLLNSARNYPHFPSNSAKIDPYFIFSAWLSTTQWQPCWTPDLNFPGSRECPGNIKKGVYKRGSTTCLS